MAGRLAPINIPWAGFAQANQIRARGAESYAQSLERGFGALASQITRGVERGQQQRNLEENRRLQKERWDYAKQMDAKRFNLALRREGRQRAVSSANMIQQQYSRYTSELEAVETRLESLAGVAPPGDPTVAALTERRAELMKGVSWAQDATSTVQQTLGLSAAQQAVEEDCGPGG